MSTIAETIDALCAKKGITGNKMCIDLGLSRSTLTELRKGRAKSIKIETAQKIADYLGVSVDYLLGKSGQKEKSPVEAGDEMPDMYFHFMKQGKKLHLEKSDLDFLLAVAEGLKKKEKQSQDKE